LFLKCHFGPRSGQLQKFILNVIDIVLSGFLVVACPRLQIGESFDSSEIRNEAVNITDGVAAAIALVVTTAEG
jgi:hypothetical protein